MSIYRFGRRQILAFSDALSSERGETRPVRIKCSDLVHSFVAFQWKMDYMKDDPNLLQVGFVIGVEDKVDLGEESMVSVVSSKWERNSFSRF